VSSHTTAAFRKAFDELPGDIQERAREAFFSSDSRRTDYSLRPADAAQLGEPDVVSETTSRYHGTLYCAVLRR
jgi:hypothetical protein